jgi:hypothetical protein
MSERKAVKFGLDLQTAKWVNDLLQKMEVREKNLIESAINIGSVLFEVQEKCKQGDFLKWLVDNVSLSQRSAYRYITLFNFKEELSDAKNLTEAYRKIATITKPKKEKEKKAADKRVDTYKKTGEKPEGWRRGTDDELAKEKTGNSKKSEKKEKVVYDKKQEGKKETVGKKEEKPKTEEQKNEEHKNNVEDDRKDEEFTDILMNYLEQFGNNSRKIIACNNIIKMCRKIVGDLS